MVEIRHVTRRFTTLSAVRNVSLHLESGKLVALLGPSGCGKTTLLRTIAGLEPCDTGSIMIDGVDVTRRPAWDRHIGFVFQSYALFPHLTARENIAFGLRVRKHSGDRIRKRVDEMLDLVGLSAFGERHPAQLSGGQRQRIALARALAVEPTILLLDEPFAALDVHVRKDLRTWLRALHDKTHVTTILVTHDPEEAMEIADRIALMNEGEIEQVGAPRDLYERPQSLFAMRFLGPVSSLPSPSGEVHARPHHLCLRAVPFPTGIEVVVKRTMQRGASIHFELSLLDGKDVTAEVPLADPAALELALRSRLYIAPLEFKTFQSLHPAPALGVICA